MGNRDQLAEHYLRGAGVAAIWIDHEGNIGAEDSARVDLARPGSTAYACPRGAHFVLAYRLQLWREEQPEAPNQAASVAQLEKLADAGGVGLTAHGVVVQRAIEIVATVEEKFDEMRAKGELREINAAFRAARDAQPSLRYADFIFAKKMELLRSMATAAPRPR